MLVPRLEHYRVQQGRLKTWLAKTLGVSRDTYRAWEEGRHMMPYDKARMLAKIYAVTMEELYEEEAGE